MNWSNLFNSSHLPKVFQAKLQIDFLGETPVFIAIGIMVVTAVCLGGLVGFDRERKHKSAGIKTNILICLGAMLYTIVSIMNQKLSNAPADPSRIAAQVVSGVGFLGAGAIIRGSGGVIGLTTAATIWVVAAIGVTIGSGFPLFATLITITTLVVLKIVAPLYNFIEKKLDQEDYLVQVLANERVLSSILSVLNNHLGEKYEIDQECINDDKGTFMFRVYARSYPKQLDFLMIELKSIVNVKEVNAIARPIQTVVDEEQADSNQLPFKKKSS